MIVFSSIVHAHCYALIVATNALTPVVVLEQVEVLANVTLVSPFCATYMH